MKAYGKKTWLIPDCYLDSVSKITTPSHEAFCVINTGNVDAEIKLTFFFEDRDPITSFSSFCGAGKTHHIRLDKLKDKEGNLVPRDVPYAALIESNTPVVVQYSRLNTSSSTYALMTTIAYSED